MSGPVKEIYRGFEIEMRLYNGKWQFVFTDTGEPTAETWFTRPCNICGEYNTEEGYDYCLGYIPGALNACCGHGNAKEAYVQFEDYSVIRGQIVLDTYQNKKLGEVPL